MEKTESLDKLQNLIDEQFNKILKLTVGNSSFNIALRRDHIPQLHTAKIEKGKLVISFENNIEIPESNSEVELLKNNDGGINALIIAHPQYLSKGSYRTKLNRIIINEVKSIPDGVDKKAILFKHIQKRIAHALSEIIKVAPTALSK